MFLPNEEGGGGGGQLPLNPEFTTIDQITVSSLPAMLIQATHERRREGCRDDMPSKNLAPDNLI